MQESQRGKCKSDHRTPPEATQPAQISPPSVTNSPLAQPKVAFAVNPLLHEFSHLFKKTVVDSNLPVQEKALDALVAFLRATDADAERCSLLGLYPLRLTCLMRTLT